MFEIKNPLSFNPEVASLISESLETPFGTTVLVGANNSGKTQWLKHAYKSLRQDAFPIGANRFYHTQQIPAASKDATLLLHLTNQSRAQEQQEKTINYDGITVNFDLVFPRLTDVQRERILTLCNDLLDADFEIKGEIPGNSFSPQYLTVDGNHISLASTGTRALLLMLVFLAYDEFKYTLIDEPELSLSPTLQNKLASIIFDTTLRTKYFPHLDHIFLATHSHLFIDRSNPKNNIRITKSGSIARLERASTISDLYNLQFTMLGNSLDTMFLPSAIIITEGDCDRDYFQHILRLKFPNNRIATLSAEGDGRVIDRSKTILEALGDLRTSPYTDRLFIVLDQANSVRKDRLIKMGIPKEQIHTLSKNGIEFYFPKEYVSKAFNVSSVDTEIEVKDNDVQLLGKSMSKKELCHQIVSMIANLDGIDSEIDGILNNVATKI